MLINILRKVLSFFGGATVSKLTDALSEGYKLRLQAQTNEKKLEVEETISRMEAQLAILLAEQGKWYTAWIRPAIALPVVIFTWKILVWDTVLQLGVTPEPGDLVRWVVVTVIAAYFIARPFEKMKK